MIMAGANAPSETDELALRALAAGKPPPNARDYFVGRDRELAVNDLDLGRIRGGSGALRILVGDLGAGKSALMAMMAEQARYQGFITASVELSPDRMLYARGGEARALLEQAVLSQRTLGSAEGVAMDALIGSFRDDCNEAGQEQGRPLRDIATERLAPLQYLPGGHDFFQVIKQWVLAIDPPRPLRQVNSRRWLSAQYTNLIEARHDLAVSRVLGDADLWPSLKLWGQFARITRRPGLMIFIDEARLISDWPDPRTRARNYSLILSIYNEVLSGQAGGVGIVLAATPDMLIGGFNSLSSERGLGSCLQQGPGQADDLIDKVVLSLSPLTEDEITELLTRVRSLLGRCRPRAPLIPVEDVPSFINSNSVQLGDHTCRHPRQIIMQFIEVHNQLSASPNLDWRELQASGQSLDEETKKPARFRQFPDREM